MKDTIEIPYKVKDKFEYTYKDMDTVEYPYKVNRFEVPYKDDLENDLKEFSKLETELRKVANDMANNTKILVEGKINAQRLRINIENGNYSYYEVLKSKLGQLREMEDLIYKYEKELNQLRPRFIQLMKKIDDVGKKSEKIIRKCYTT